MGLFDFLENRLDEYLRNNPHLELQYLEEQLREQEADTKRLIIDLQAQEKRSQDEILATAQEIQRWHSRIDKAKAAGRMDLVQSAQEREAALLRQGNQLWGKMQGFKQQIEQAKELQQKIHLRRQEVQTKVNQAQATRSTSQAKTTWESAAPSSQNYTYSASNAADPLEKEFQNWETEDELEKLKRNMGR